MAELKYSKDGRLLFTKEMKKEYTILLPQMLPVHFAIIQSCLEAEGYKCAALCSEQRQIADIGLKYVHNDTCYPALLVIGQFIEAINSGKYDKHKVALMITQTGGGCRASNYIHLLRKALKRADLEYIPVISLNLSGLESNPGFKLSIKLIREMIYSLIYGDIIIMLANQCRPYEVKKGETDALVHTWQQKLVDGFKKRGTLNFKTLNANFEKITADFAQIALAGEKKPRVGVVGEIYVKYSPLGNNNLEDFLLSENVETVIPGITDFIIFKIYNRYVDVDLYGGKKIKKFLAGVLQRYIEKCQNAMIAQVEKYPQFRAPEPFAHLRDLAMKYLGLGNKMGEGWLLTGEMLELIESGTGNIVCTQPFGCLPNHIVGKGMIRRLKDDYPESNIVAIDYDPSATKINQENRIKLMLANARRLQKAAASEGNEKTDLCAKI